MGEAEVSEEEAAGGAVVEAVGRLNVAVHQAQPVQIR
jgi:hypothetical protein